MGKWSDYDNISGTYTDFAGLSSTAKFMTAVGNSQYVFTKAQLQAWIQDDLGLANIVKATVTKDLASISAGAESTETFTVTGALTTDSVVVNAASGLSAGLIITNAWVSAADTVSVTFYNWTASPVDQASKDFYITCIH